jgi:hypothetical protein
MNIPTHLLKPIGGEIYAHLFENPQQGVERSVFWSVTVDFEKFKYQSEDFDCCMTCEWIRWPIRDWRLLDGKELDVNYGDNGVEASFYRYQHHPASRATLSLRHVDGSRFNTKMSLAVLFGSVEANELQNPTLIEAEVILPFTGLLVVSANLQPEINGVKELTKAVAQSVDLTAFGEPQAVGDSLRFPPFM